MLNGSYPLTNCCHEHQIFSQINDAYSVYIKLNDSEVLTLSGQHDTFAPQTVIFVTITGLAFGQRAASLNPLSSWEDPGR